MTRKLVVGALLLWAVSVSPARAATIVWAVDLDVTYIGSDPVWEPYLPLLGTSITGEVSFDSDASPFQVDHFALFDVAYYPTGPWELQLPGLNTTWTSSGGYIQIHSGVSCGFDCFGLFTDFASSSGPTPLALELRSGHHYFSTDLPRVPPEMLSFVMPTFTNPGVSGDTHLTAIPEPATLSLIALGLALIAARHRE